jgi:pimeloyl-ACP methyl ester carboxylesterase
LDPDNIPFVGIQHALDEEAGVADSIDRASRPYRELMEAGHGRKCEGALRLHQGFFGNDFTKDLKDIAVPALVMHGDDAQVVPYADSGPLSAKLLKNATLKTYKG